MIKLHIVSDLHLAHGGPPVIPLDVFGDVLILAGDMADGLHPGALRAAGLLAKGYIDIGRPVIWILGNHEMYGRSVSDAKHACAAAAATLGFIFLDDTYVDIPHGMRFFGATLWTDHALYGDPERARKAAKSQMNDFRRIRGLTPSQTENLHRESVRLLLEAASTLPPHTRLVVVTHHAPSPKCIAPQYVGIIVNPSFASDLTQVIRDTKPILWIHGHTHASVDFKEGLTRVVCNPRGYPIRSSWENEDYDANFIVQL